MSVGAESVTTIPLRQDSAARPIPVAPRPSEKRLGFFAGIRAMRTNPLTSFPEAAYKARTLEVGRLRRVLLVNEPAGIEHVLVGNANNYRKSIQQRRRLKPALGEGLLTAEGESWRGARRITSPLFNPRAIGLLLGDMRDVAAAMRERWLARAASSEPMNLSDEFQRLTYEVVSRTVFSGALDADRVFVHAQMAEYFETFGRVDLASALNLPLWFPTPSSLRRRPVPVFRSIVDRVVKERVAAPARGGADLLDQLMVAPDPVTGRPMPIEKVADNVLTFLAAGHETTGNALAWVLYLLSLYPDVAEAVVAEMGTVSADELVRREGLERLPFTRAVIDESMRLYPPAPFVGREAIAADVIDGRPVKPGTQVLISPWIVHRHQALWEAPETFRPERFLAPQAAKIPRGAFIPFGLGPRICIGQGFAVQEMLIVLATILPAFTFRLADATAVQPHARITLRSNGGMPMFVAPR